MAALEVYADTYRALGYDLPAAIEAYTLAMAEFVTTEDEPAPAAASLVEVIVRYHEGQFVIVPSPLKPETQPLPKDPKYYKSATDREAVEAEA
jgi:hypothetical protein